MRLQTRIFTIVLMLYTSHAADILTPLDHYVKHYEGLNYDRTALHERHMRAKRSLDSGVESDQTVELQFSAHDRDFHLRLKKDVSIFTEDFVVETSDGEDSNYDTSHIYAGVLQDEPSSMVHGSILDGLFEGKVYIGGEEYYIEPASRYFDDQKEFHSVIYKGSDVDYPYPHGAQCGVSDTTKDWMRGIQEAARKELPNDMVTDDNWSNEAHYGLDNKYANPVKRRKRAIPALHTCTLYIQTDHTYTLAFDNNDQVISQITNYLGAVNAIYRRTDFNGLTGISFAIKRIRINGTVEQQDKSNPFRANNIGVEKFLDLNSEQNHNGYCLAYIFTNRDFEGGVLGLAWIAYDYRGAFGGICDTYRDYFGRKVSFNTGIITIQNYGSRVATQASHITFAHELGHNFGSPHDFPLDCRPGDSDSERQVTDGNYIMYAMARTGDKLNNNKFSDCSIGNMSIVLSAKKDKCFIESLGQFCGNGIVEDGEECDCGFEDQCKEECCYAETQQTDPRACTRIKGNCSPSEGPCCSNACVAEDVSIVCDTASDCNDVQYCDGVNAKCPLPKFKVNGTECNNNRQVCKNGECTGSICEASSVKMEECSCEGEGYTNKEMCHVCCQTPGKPGTCKSSAFIDELVPYYTDTARGVINRQPGSPCDNNHGYCDVYNNCRLVDAEGPLARLRTALMDPDARKDWIETYWWVVLIIVGGILILSAAGLALCILCTPSSNPRLPEPCTCTTKKKPKSRYDSESSGAIKPARDSTV